jgi:hypothetical protein
MLLSLFQNCHLKQYQNKEDIKVKKTKAEIKKGYKVPPLPSEEGGSGGRAWRNSKPAFKNKKEV